MPPVQALRRVHGAHDTHRLVLGDEIGLRRRLMEAPHLLGARDERRQQQLAGHAVTLAAVADALGQHLGRILAAGVETADARDVGERHVVHRQAMLGAETRRTATARRSASG